MNHLNKQIPDIHFKQVPADVYDALRDYAYHNRISIKAAFILAVQNLTGKDNT